MLLAKINGTQVAKYPYLLDELYADNPSVYFPPNPTDEILAAHNAARVVVTSAPAYDSRTHTAEQIGCAYSSERDRWETSWVVRLLTAQEMAQALQAIQDEIVTQTQARLDDFARTRAYDGILSACTYANSAVPKFQLEGQYCVNARDATWEQLYTMLAEVEAGTRPVPAGYADIEPELPALVWPA